MSPTKFNEDDLHHNSRRGEINGQRPSPLKINKGSHFIHKASSTSSMSSSVCCVAPMARQQQRQPVIIYTHSPKIIHTHARDFMALVQKLTGASPSRSHYDINANKTTSPLVYLHDDNESATSALTDENSNGGAELKASSTSNNMSSIQNQTNHEYFADMPLFTPNTTNFFCSPRPVFRYPDSAYGSPKFANSMSPSVYEFMKGLPEY